MFGLRTVIVVFDSVRVGDSMRVCHSRCNGILKNYVYFLRVARVLEAAGFISIEKVGRERVVKKILLVDKSLFARLRQVTE